jgi:hypothetical protein
MNNCPKERDPDREIQRDYTRERCKTILQYRHVERERDYYYYIYLHISYIYLTLSKGRVFNRMVKCKPPRESCSLGG